MSLNRAMVIGNLGGDPVLRNLPSGQPAVAFSIATDESFTDKERARSKNEWNGIRSLRSGSWRKPAINT